MTQHSSNTGYATLDLYNPFDNTTRVSVNSSLDVILLEAWKGCCEVSHIRWNATLLRCDQKLTMTRTTGKKEKSKPADKQERGAKTTQNGHNSWERTKQPYGEHNITCKRSSQRETEQLQIYGKKHWGMQKPVNVRIDRRIGSLCVWPLSVKTLSSQIWIFLITCHMI